VADEDRPARNDDADREQQAGHGKHDVHEPHDHRVDSAAEVARDCPEKQPDRQSDRDGDNADQKRVAGAVNNPRELVSSLLIDAEEMIGGGAGTAAPLKSAKRVLDAFTCRILRCDQRGEHRDRHEEADEPEADQRARVSPQPVPGIAPQTARRRLELDFSGFELGDAHETLILGLMSAYERSTSRLTSTKMMARKRIPPWSTG
jgi:hypothetical protein